MKRRINTLASSLCILICLAGCFTFVKTAPTSSTSCGSIDASSSFEVGSELSSCNGHFTVNYRTDGNVVLTHVPTKAVIWQQAAVNGNGALFSIYSSPLQSNSQPGDLASRIRAAAKPSDDLQPPDITNPSDFPTQSETSNSGGEDTTTEPPVAIQTPDPLNESDLLGSPGETEPVGQEVKRRSPDNDSSSSSRMVLQDNGNLIIFQGEAGKQVWTSNTQGTDCKKVFITDSAREKLAQDVESKGRGDVANGARHDICALFNGRWESVGIKSYEDVLPSSNVAKRVWPPPGAYLKRRTVINQFQFYFTLTGFYPGQTLGKCVIATAYLEKTWQYNGVEVFGSTPDKEPPVAYVHGEVVGWANWVNFIWGGLEAGSQFEGYEPITNTNGFVIGNPHSAHVSRRSVRIQWRLFIVNEFIQAEQWTGQQMYIKGFASGDVHCEYQTHCIDAKGPTNSNG